MGEKPCRCWRGSRECGGGRARTSSKYQTPNTKHRTPITNHRTSNTNHQSPFTNHQLPITNHQTPNTDHQTPNTEHQSPNTEHRSRNTKHRSPITNHQSRNTKHQTPNTKKQTQNTNGRCWRGSRACDGERARTQSGTDQVFFKLVKSRCFSFLAARRICVTIFPCQNTCSTVTPSVGVGVGLAHAAAGPQGPRVARQAP